MQDVATKNINQLDENNHGILLIDKPTDMTSHDVVNIVRKKTGVKRVGHAGTLDPLATGLLIILVGKQFTKLQSKFLKTYKTYLCTAQLGIETDTYDIDGEVIKETEWKKLEKITKQQLEKTLEQFEGKNFQTVPAFSAVKVKGKKLYKQARKKKIDKSKLPKREIVITRLNLTSFKKDVKKKQILFSIEVRASSGTYIRSLIHDIGEKLRVGATITKLRRTQVKDLNIKDAISLEEIKTTS